MTTTGMNVIGVQDQNLEKHMGGCMAGFFNILSSKRLYPKRLPPSEPVSGEIPKPEVTGEVTGEYPAKSPAPAPATRSPWKFSREAPRLSLDSRAVVDAKGGLHPREIRTAKCGGGEEEEEERESRQRRSPSVIARLMGLEACPNSKDECADGIGEVVVVMKTKKKVEVLKRSASESRSRDYKFLDAPTFLSKDWMSSSSDTSTLIRNTDTTSTETNNANATKVQSSNNNNNGSNNPQQQRRFGVERKKNKCYYDTADVFPRENKYQCQYRYQNHQQQQQHLHLHHHQQHQAVTIYGEIERRLRMRGIDEPSKDLETLKHILEALQLKGLLHSSTTTTTTTTMAAKPVARRNVVFDRRNEEEGSPIVVMKPARTPRRSAGEAAVSPRRERPVASHGVRRKGGPLRVETTTTAATAAATSAVQRRSINSPTQSPRRRGSGDHGVSRSPRGRRSTVEVPRRERGRGGGGGNGSGPEVTEDEEVSTLSESSFSTNSHIDNERWRVEEYREGRNLLERCDKLLHSIAEMNSNSNSNPNLVELQQPSPVSVLDSSFYKEDESSPSPVKKRTIDFKDQVMMELEEDLWSPSSSTHHHHHNHHQHNQDIDSSDDSDFTYVSEVLRASYYFPDETHSDLFLLLEKQTCSRKDRSKPCVIQRKLVFDTITEILDRNRQLPPWKAAAASPGRPTLQQIWAEFRRIREQAPSDDLLEVICGVLKKDLAGDAINGWGDCHVEVSEAVLDIERLIFKDLIGETIRDLVATAGKSVGNQAPRRKLVF